MANAQRVSYFKANLEDKPGTLLKVLEDLKAKNIGLSGLWGFATKGGRADLYVVAEKPDQLRNAWKGSGMLSEEGTGFLLNDADRTGALVEPLQALASAGVNITAIDAIAVDGKYGSFVWVDQSNVDKAAKALGAK